MIGLISFLLLMGACTQIAGAQTSDTGPWDMADLSKAPRMEWLENQGPVRPLLFSGLRYRGKETSVFAYYADPATLQNREPKPGERFPAVVLIHGASGTAFSQWAKLWAERGYAAIALDHAGGRSDILTSTGQASELEGGGPLMTYETIFSSIKTGISGDDWVYHAVADTVLAHSLLLSFQQVDADRTAITGISWGGFLCEIAASIDDRFKAAVSFYGCGYLSENSAPDWLKEFRKLGPLKTQAWTAAYDPSTYLPRCRVPMLFINGTNDLAFPLDSYVKTYETVKTAPKNILIIPDLPHDHPVGWSQKEVALFIDSYLRGGAPLPKCGPLMIKEGKLSVEITSRLPIKKATLYQAKLDGPINKLTWSGTPMIVDSQGAYVETILSEGVLYFALIEDQSGASCSSVPRNSTSSSL